MSKVKCDSPLEIERQGNYMSNKYYLYISATVKEVTEQAYY